jgi:hypothetical protein
VINDPDGYTNVRDYDGKVLAKVKGANALSPQSHGISLAILNGPFV